MAVTSARYTSADGAFVEAVIDGATMVVPMNSIGGYVVDQVKAWIAAGNTPNAYAPTAGSAQNAQAWYWVVANSTTQVYSSASGGFVATTDVTYVAWKNQPNVAIPVDTNDALAGQLLDRNAPRPVDAGVLASWQSARANRMEYVLLRGMFNHENRIRALEGKVALTQAQFIAGVAGLL